MSFHRIRWSDFDRLARGDDGPDVIRQLRDAQRSRRLLLLLAFLDKVQDPTLYQPLPAPEESWELLLRVQEANPDALDTILAHPYTGSWLSYVLRRVQDRVDLRGMWMYVGHFHALAAAAATRAHVDFEAHVPAWNGCVTLPTLGVCRLAEAAEWSVAEVRGHHRTVEISTSMDRLRLPSDLSVDNPQWTPIRLLETRSRGRRCSIRLDDLDPYRGQNGPKPPQRLDQSEVDDWQALLDGAWELIVRCHPAMADSLSAGLHSLVPYQLAHVRNQSGSTTEAFGGIMAERPLDATSLAVTLIHEFQHIRLGGLLHLVDLSKVDSSRRFYTLWRDDPRHVAGVLQGTFAFFGMTAFWRALAQSEPENRRAWFEFAYCRTGTWRTLRAVSGDPSLTEAGQRFVDGITERLGPWQEESVPSDIAELAATAATDHYAGWRLRHVEPSRDVVTRLAEAWLSRRALPGTLELPPDREPKVDPDGSWPGARTDLIRLRLMREHPGRSAATLPAVAHAVAADFAYETGDVVDAAHLYRAELKADPDSPNALVGLGLSLAALGDYRPARALLTYPELVRAVHREIRGHESAPGPEELARGLLR